MGLVKIIAHRGASAYAPENTLAAFKLAREQGADFFELDVRQCKTGRAVVMHDATVDRTTSGHGRVSKLTLTQLRKFTVGGRLRIMKTGLRVPTLREALALASPEFRSLVEIKGGQEPRIDAPRVGKRCKQSDADFLSRFDHHTTVRMVRAVVEDVRALRQKANVVVQSSSIIACCVTRILEPDIRVELLVPRLRISTIRPMRLAHYFGLAGINTEYRQLDQEDLRMLKAEGLSCSVYTVNEPEDMLRLAEWGVDGIITDRPDVCREVLARTPSPARKRRELGE